MYFYFAGAFLHLAVFWIYFFLPITKKKKKSFEPNIKFFLQKNACTQILQKRKQWAQTLFFLQWNEWIILHLYGRIYVSSHQKYDIGKIAQKYMINSYSKHKTKFYMQWSESSTLSQA